MQSEEIAFLIGEGGALIQHGVVEQVVAGE